MPFQTKGRAGQEPDDLRSLSLPGDREQKGVPPADNRTGLLEWRRSRLRNGDLSEGPEQSYWTALEIGIFCWL